MSGQMNMIRKRIKSQKVGYQRSIKGWTNTLVDVPAFILGNCPYLPQKDLRLLKNHFTIGINRAFYVLDPTILMWQDSELWYTEKSKIVKTEAIKFCRDSADIQGRFLHFRISGNSFAIPDSAEVLHGRGSTGPLAFQLAWILGCNPIVLLGMSCKYHDGKTDFYGKNASHKPHTLRNCSKGLEWISKCERMGRTIYNCCPSSHFDKHFTLDSVLKDIGESSTFSREFFIKRLLKSDK